MFSCILLLPVSFSRRKADNHALITVSLHKLMKVVCTYFKALEGIVIDPLAILLNAEMLNARINGRFDYAFPPEIAVSDFGEEERIVAVASADILKVENINSAFEGFYPVTDIATALLNPTRIKHK